MTEGASPSLHGLRHRPLGAALAVMLFAVMSFSLWRGEVEYFKGWPGLAWLNGYPWSALPISLLVAASVLTPIEVAAPLSPRRSLMFLLVVGVVGWIAFEVARRWFFADRSWLLLGGLLPTTSDYVFSPLLSIVLAVAGIQQAIHRLLVPVPLWTMVFFLVAILLDVPLSLLSLKLVPAHGATDFYHAIKAGYTMFWVNILLGAASALTMRCRASGALTA